MGLAAAAYWFNPGVMEILLQASTSSLIIETVWKAAAGNERSGKAIIELLSRKSEIRITWEILHAAAKNL